MIEKWQHLYDVLDPIALDLGFFQLRWYGIFYASALLLGYYIGRIFVQKGRFKISLNQYDLAFLWVELGVVLGARLGYVLFYDPNTAWYFSHPWQIFNPFYNGEFVGISGLSYHGAIFGFVVAAIWFSRVQKISAITLLDLSVLAGSAGYFLGRIGNFLNNRLVGRETDMPWGIYTDGILRHPSALYEAFLEGIVVFFILLWYQKRAKFPGALMAMYGMLYATARFTAEFFRKPDDQLGFVWLDFFSMGQVLSLVMFGVSLILWIYFKNLAKKPVKKTKAKA